MPCWKEFSMGGKRELYTMILAERIEFEEKHADAMGARHKACTAKPPEEATGRGTAAIDDGPGGEESRTRQEKGITNEQDKSSSASEADAYVDGWLAAACGALESVKGLFKEPRIAVEALFDHMVLEEGEAFIDALLTYSGFPDDWGEDEEEDCSDELEDWKFGDSPEEQARKEAFMAAWERESNQLLGDRGEEAAARCLKGKGYEILERKYRCDYGEADIVALSPDGAVVFVEVKTRRSLRAGFPEEAITATKRRRYERIAIDYMTKSDWEDGTPIRFDAVGICVQSNGRAVLRHHIGFFDACD